MSQVKLIYTLNHVMFLILVNVLPVYEVPKMLAANTALRSSKFQWSRLYVVAFWPRLRLR